jgi:hypothetical protein
MSDYSYLIEYQVADEEAMQEMYRTYPQAIERIGKLASDDRIDTAHIYRYCLDGDGSLDRSQMHKVADFQLWRETTNESD